MNAEVNKTGTFMPKTLFSLLNDAHAPVVVWRGRAEGVEISGVTADSREVEAGAVFVSCPSHHAAAFVAEAIQRGARAVVTADPESVAQGPCVLECSDPRRAFGALAHAWVGHPSKAMKVIGVTGTNGKTTTVTLLKHGLDHCGLKSGLIGTVECSDGDEAGPSRMTTPDAGAIAGLLARMKVNGCGAAALEVSSHGLDQQRLAGIDFSAAVFTNLSGDHLDYHGSMAAYTRAKATLFEGLSAQSVAIVNAEDRATAAILKGCRASVIQVAVGGDAPCDLRVTPLEVDADGMTLGFLSEWGRFEGRVPLVGSHNAFNVAAAVATGGALGVSFAEILGAMATAPAPRGRLEPVHDGRDDVRVFVDYAHTDDALANVLRAIRPVVSDSNSLTVVFGAGGDRDRAKRSRMAERACAEADRIVVTSDNPRTEDPDAILKDILAGVPASAQARVAAEVDRRAAIEGAIRAADAGDVLVIAGKGHEAYQIIGTERRPFDDVAVAREALTARRGGAS